MLRQSLFADSGRLLARVVHAAQRGDPVTFLFGTALTAPGAHAGELGVPDANALVEEVVKSFRGTDQFDALESALKQASPPGRYQATMKFVIDCRGQSAL